MDTMALTRLATPRKQRVTLAAAPAAAAVARGEVRTAIRAWQVPVDPSVAARLTSELVANALTHGTGKTIEVVVSCSYGQLQVDVYDFAPARELPAGAPAAAAGRGLMLLAALSTSWGYDRTPAGVAGFFTLMF